MKIITITISPAGKTTVETSGFKGKGCAEATEQIEIALGGAAGPRNKKKKPEFFQPATTGTAIKRTF